MRGKKILGNQKKCDNNGDGLYELVGRWKKIAKQNMHQTIRARLKNQLKKEDNY